MATALKFIDPAENETLAALEAKSKTPSPFFRAMAHRPDVLKNFPPLYAAIMGPGSVDRRTKELVYLATAYTNKCPYCIASHVVGGRKAGISEEELHSLEAGHDTGATDAERAAVRYAYDLAKTATASESRAALSAHFSDEQVVELTLVACMANFTNRFNNGLNVLPLT